MLEDSTNIGITRGFIDKQLIQFQLNTFCLVTYVKNLIYIKIFKKTIAPPLILYFEV